jgi:hypothetical protein
VEHGKIYVNTARSVDSDIVISAEVLIDGNKIAYLIVL